MQLRDRIARFMLFAAVLVASDRYVGRMIHAIRTAPMDKKARAFVERSMAPECRHSAPTGTVSFIVRAGLAAVVIVAVARAMGVEI